MLCRASPVIVCASHIALGDLGLNLRPAVVAQHRTDCQELGRSVTVVEFEHDHIGLAAVDTRVIE
ncbi:MAG: hypothetical protein E6I52_15890 [Chloroflexi bacterium]|nr:MAG: hypothetical protein E6I52_15890 [Chloroflexota bacterium]